MKRAAILGFCLVACSAPKPATPTPSGSPTPLIVVDGARFSLDGEVLDGRALAQRLAERKASEQWFDLTRAERSSGFSALNFGHLAHPDRVHLKTKTGWLDAKLQIAPTARPIHSRAVIALVGADAVLEWQSDGACEALPPFATMLQTELPRRLDEICQGVPAPCVDDTKIFVAKDAALTDALDVLDAVRGHSDASLSFELLPAHVVGAIKPPPEPVCGEPLTQRDFGDRLDPALAMKLLDERRPLYSACYDAALKRAPGLRGRITATLTIETSGVVSSVKLEASTTITDPELRECVVALHRETRFPPRSKKARVGAFTYPIVFEP